LHFCKFLGSGKNSSAHKLSQKLKKRNQELQEENNLLKIKFEVVLNMVNIQNIGKSN